MKSFLLLEKTPICKWSCIPENIYFEGKVPEGYQLAVSPSGSYVVLDVDKHGEVNGFDNIPQYIKDELDQTFNYPTKNNGRHYWLYYTGAEELLNKTSGLSLDLRTSKGYVVFYPDGDIRQYQHLIHTTTTTMNSWLESLFKK